MLRDELSIFEWEKETEFLRVYNYDIIDSFLHNVDEMNKNFIKSLKL